MNLGGFLLTFLRDHTFNYVVMLDYFQGIGISENKMTCLRKKDWQFISRYELYEKHTTYYIQSIVETKAKQLLHYFP